MLQYIELQDVGPAHQMRLDFAPRLNILTGDNGLGKTFALDVAWWALTHSWPDRPALPIRNGQSKPQIACAIVDTKHGDQHRKTDQYNFAAETWSPRPPSSDGGLVIYARVDGGFSTWDAIRNQYYSVPTRLADVERPKAYHFTVSDLWAGLEGTDRRILCNGLIRDWVSWQFQSPEMFGVFKEVLAALSPCTSEVLRPGKPARISIEDARDIPTLELPYGTVPITHAAAGVQRALGLAYVMMWAWSEYRSVCELTLAPAVGQIVLLIDEVEAHLHPQWQRTILPSVLRAADVLPDAPDVQVLTSTHAPLVLASVEADFDEQRDKVFNFVLEDRNVKIREVSWAKQGDTVGWLTSEVFGLQQARSREAENAIEAAEAFMRGDTDALPPHLQTEDAIHQELTRVLADHDPFWPRWIVDGRGQG